MKLLGIDYGAKRVGIAVADSDTGVAFPKSVLPNDKYLFTEIKNLCEVNKIDKIILGESKDLKGEANEIMKAIESFKKLLEVNLPVDVIYEPEFYTSVQASHIQGENGMIDASAATIILQSYLDKFKG